jgi:putative inorganic carbon (HCO3(-)) transporter
MWRYTCAALVLWVVNPELRRLFEWRFGYGSVDVFPLLPFLAVLPHVWSLTYGGGWRRLSRPLTIASWIWLGAFGYAFVLAVAKGNVLPGAYAFANFVLPIVIGLWVAADELPTLKAYARTMRLLYVLTTIVSAYGIVQYVVAPEWDRLWLRHVIESGSLSFGLPAPFEIRVFSMLSSPQPFGTFVAIMLLFALPGLSLRRPLGLLPIPIWIVAFGLSLDRTGWLIFAAGAVIYTLLAPSRGVIVATASLCAALVAGAVLILPAATGNGDVVAVLQSRLTTFSDLENDRSGNERRELYASALGRIAQAPLGEGLGVVGTSTKLGSAAVTTDVDSGLLGRLFEMGLPGAALFLTTLGVLVAAAGRVWQSAQRAQDAAVQGIAAVAIAAIVSHLGSEIFTDLAGLPLLALWLICALAARPDSINFQRLVMPVRHLPRDMRQPVTCA